MNSIGTKPHNKRLDRPGSAARIRPVNRNVGLSGEDIRSACAVM